MTPTCECWTSVPPSRVTPLKRVNLTISPGLPPASVRSVTPLLMSCAVSCCFYLVGRFLTGLCVNGHNFERTLQ